MHCLLKWSFNERRVLWYDIDNVYQENVMSIYVKKQIQSDLLASYNW